MTSQGSGLSGAIDTQVLSRPIAIGSLQLANRIVMAPMTRYFSPRGVPGPDVAEYYARRTVGGAGLIITEGTFINHPSAGYVSSVPDFFGDALAGWQDAVSAVHEAGGKIMPQLWHTGMQTQPNDVEDPARPRSSASGMLTPGEKTGEPMTLAEIDALIAAFAAAAADADRVGFDGIELHGAHGYLLDSFFWHGTNHRTDRFGGSVEARAQIGAEVIRACRAATRPDFPICLRFSQWKNVDYEAQLAETPAELERFLQPLVDAGVDILHCSTRRFWLPEFEGSDLNLAGWCKKITGLPTISVGSVGLSSDFFGSFAEEQTAVAPNLGRLVEMMERGDFDLIAVGRALLGDPDWPRKVMRGALDELTPFSRDALGSLN